MEEARLKNKEIENLKRGESMRSAVKRNMLCNLKTTQKLSIALETKWMISQECGIIWKASWSVESETLKIAGASTQLHYEDEAQPPKSEAITSNNERQL